MRKNDSRQKADCRRLGHLPTILLLCAFVFLLRVPALVFSEDLQDLVNFKVDASSFVPANTFANVDTSNVFPITNFVPVNTDLKLELPENFKMTTIETLDVSNINWNFTPVTLSLANMNFKTSFYDSIFSSSAIAFSPFSTSYAFPTLNINNKSFSALNAQLSYSFSSPIAQAKVTLPQVTVFSGSAGIKPATTGGAASSPLTAASNPSLTDKSSSAPKVASVSKLPVTAGNSQQIQDGVKVGQSQPQIRQVNPAADQGLAQTMVKAGNGPEQTAAAANIAPGSKIDNTGPANEFTFSSANPNKKDAVKGNGAGVNPEMLQEVDMNVALQQGSQPQRDNQADVRASQYSAPMTGLKSESAMQSPISAALLLFQDSRLPIVSSSFQPQVRSQEAKPEGEIAKAAKDQDKTVKTFLPLPQQGLGLAHDETQMNQDAKLEIKESQVGSMAAPNVAEEEAEGAAPVPAENDLAYQNSNPQIMMAKALDAFKSDPMDLFGGMVTYQEVKKAALNDQERAKSVDRGVKVETATVPSGPITAISAAFNPMRISESDRFFTAFEVPPSRPIKEALNELVATARSFYRQALDYWTQK